MKTSSITVYRLNRANKVEQTLFCATGLTGGTFFLLAACLTHGLGSHIFCALLGLGFSTVGIFLLLRRRCVVDWTKRLITDEFKLLQYQVRQREAPFADFENILVRRNRRASEQDIYCVYLQKRDGDLIPLRFFSVPEGRDCPEAPEYAQKLSADFGFPVIEKDGLGQRRLNPLSL
ncbi:MAG TPA: hypothetical protein VG347_05620 [Verrucomicrobiae bacterium]|nr:hypothetical protein [Verrucomicrobiae bacterium]